MSGANKKMKVLDNSSVLVHLPFLRDPNSWLSIDNLRSTNWYTNYVLSYIHSCWSECVQLPYPKIFFVLSVSIIVEEFNCCHFNCCHWKVVHRSSIWSRCIRFLSYVHQMLCNFFVICRIRFWSFAFVVWNYVSYLYNFQEAYISLLDKLCFLYFVGHNHHKWGKTPTRGMAQAINTDPRS